MEQKLLAILLFMLAIVSVRILDGDATCAVLLIMIAIAAFFGKEEDAE